MNIAVLGNCILTVFTSVNWYTKCIGYMIGVPIIVGIVSMIMMIMGSFLSIPLTAIMGTCSPQCVECVCCTMETLHDPMCIFGGVFIQLMIIFIATLMYANGTCYRIKEDLEKRYEREYAKLTKVRVI